MTIPRNQKANISAERFLEIEAVAQKARRLAAVRWMEAYQQTDATTAPYPLWIELEALCFVALLLVGGKVTGVPNLCVDGERLAGGIAFQGQGKANIFYESYDPWVRQRFSIAHELGHFFLHEAIIQALGGHHHDPSRQTEDSEEDSGSSETTRLWEDDPLLEREANSFAAAFLMPSALVVEDVAYFGHAIPFLAGRYGVSHAALRKRLQILKPLSFFGEATLRIEGWKFSVSGRATPPPRSAQTPEYIREIAYAQQKSNWLLRLPANAK